MYINTQVQELKRTHRFSVTLSFAPKHSSKAGDTPLQVKT